MSKLLRIKDYVLIAAASVGEIAEDIRLVGDLMPEMMKTRYGFIPPNYKRQSYFSSVSKLLSTGEIERKIDSKGNPFLELTSKGISTFKRKFPILSFQKEKWDGNFMVVIFDIEEKNRRERDALRIKLKELGFGMLQESVFISPYHFEEDFQEFLETHGLDASVYVLRTKALKVGDYQKLVRKIWNLEAINEEYSKILEKIKDEKDDPKKLWNEYFEIALKDPFLPPELLPNDWKRKEVLVSLQNIHGRV